MTQGTHIRKLSPFSLAHLALGAVFGLLFTVFVLPAKTQTIIKETGIPFIRHYTKKDYTGGTQNWDFAQTENGLLYVANNQGVIIYDGTEWELIALPNRSVVRSLFRDQNDRIYVGGFNEFGYISDNSGNQPVFVSLHQAAGEIETGEIWRIVRQDDYIHFQSYTALVSWNTRSDTWHVQRPAVRFGFLHQVGERLLINQDEAGLFELQGLDLKPLSRGGFFASMDVWDILPWKGNMLVCTQNYGIFQMGESGIEPWDAPVNDFLLENRFYSSGKAGPYFFWGSIRDGLVVSDENGQLIKHLHQDVGLKNNTILSVFPDREGALWLGLDNGIAQILSNLALSELKMTKDIGTGYAAALFENRIYLGTNQGLFWVENFMEKGPDRELLEPNQVEELTGQVWSLKVFGDELLVGHNLGAFAIRNDQVRKIGLNPGGWMFAGVPDRPAEIMEGSYYGLERYSLESGQVTWLNQIDGFSESSRSMFFESNRVLWMGHGYEGIFRIELDRELTHAVSVTCYDAGSGLGMKNFNELLTVDHGVVVSNPDGFFKYDPQLDDFVPAPLWNDHFLRDGRMTRLVRQSDERFWYFQEQAAGAVRVINDTILIKDERSLAPLKGSFNPSFENMAFLSDRDMLIGIDEGFVHLDPEWSAPNPESCPVRFKSFTLLKNDSVIRMKQASTDQDSTGGLIIPYRFNELRIRYAAPCLTIPDQTEYRYWLEGHMPGWSAWTVNTYAEFFGLREDDYLMRVQARNIFGSHAREGLLAFTVKTPWYRSLIAYISYLLLVVSLSLLSWYLINQKLEREKRRTKILEERRMLHQQLKLKRDSERAEKEIVKLRNDKLRADIRHKSKELANQTLGIIQKNKFLTEIKDEMVRLKRRAQNEDVKASMTKMIRKIDRNIEDEDTQQIFETNFDQVHENFMARLRLEYPHLTAKDLRLCAYLRLNLSSKEIAPLLNISVRGVEISRYRLRKKLYLDHKEHLTDFILRF